MHVGAIDRAETENEAKDDKLRSLGEQMFEAYERLRSSAGIETFVAFPRLILSKVGICWRLLVCVLIVFYE